uniref:Putative secreted protein n=1 Tax=Ixodes ricinus TaxID=34613 RepID=A0A6B0U3I2_IXORI
MCPHLPAASAAVAASGACPVAVKADSGTARFLGRVSFFFQPLPNPSTTSWEERLADDTATGQQWLMDYAESLAATYGSNWVYWKEPIPLSCSTA